MFSLRTVLTVIVFVSVLSGPSSLTLGYKVVPFQEDDEDFQFSGDHAHDETEDTTDPMEAQKDIQDIENSQQYNHEKIESIWKSHRHQTKSEKVPLIKEKHNLFHTSERRRKSKNQKENRHHLDHFLSVEAESMTQSIKQLIESSLERDSSRQNQRNRPESTMPPKVRRKHVFYATENINLLSLLGDEASGGSHRKVIVYNLIPDELREKIIEDREKSSERDVKDRVSSVPWQYYDALARSVTENGRHGAVVFDRDANHDKRSGGSQAVKRKSARYDLMSKDARQSSKSGLHGSSGRLQDIPFHSSSKNDYADANTKWPKFQSLLKADGGGSSHGPRRHGEEIVSSEEEEVQPPDEDYQSDSYHRRVPAIDDYLEMNLEGTEEGGVPRFLSELMNISMPIGKEIVLSCAVTSLGVHKVGWIRLNDQTVLTLNDRLLTSNKRIKISTNKNLHYQLHIHQAAMSDAGCYMCQVNTEVMMKQVGCVDIMTTPDIDDSKSPADVAIAEYDNATLYCEPCGNPLPSIIWTRSDDRDLLLKNPSNNELERIPKYNGTHLHLYKADRRQMGSYQCTAENGVPPSKTKHVTFMIHFEPKVNVPVQIIGTPLGGDITFTCHTEGYPDTINYWCRDGNPQHVLMNGTKHTVVQTRDEKERWKLAMTLTIRSVAEKDLGVYTCEATNSLGKTSGNVRVYEISGMELEQYQQNRVQTTASNMTSSARGCPLVVEKSIIELSTICLSVLWVCKGLMNISY